MDVGLITAPIALVVALLLIVAGFADSIAGHFEKARQGLAWMYRAGGRWRKMHRVLTSPSGRAALVIVGVLTTAVIVYREVNSFFSQPAILPTVVQPSPGQLSPEGLAEEVAKRLRMPESAAIKEKSLPNIILVERFPESWGYPQGKVVTLDRATRFRMPVGSLQWFNPQAGNPDGLSEAVFNVTVFLTFPDSDLELVQVPAPWRPTESNRPRSVTYYAEFGDLNQGTPASAPVSEQWRIRALVARTFDIVWTIQGRGERYGGFPPIRRDFQIEAFTP